MLRRSKFFINGDSEEFHFSYKCLFYFSYKFSIANVMLLLSIFDPRNIILNVWGLATILLTLNQFKTMCVSLISTAETVARDSCNPCEDARERTEPSGCITLCQSPGLNVPLSS